MKEMGFEVGGRSGFGEHAQMTAGVSIDRQAPRTEQKHLEGSLADKIRGGFSEGQQILLAQLIESADLDVGQIENIPEEEVESAYNLFHKLVQEAEGNGGKLDKIGTTKLYGAIVEGIYAL